MKHPRLRSQFSGYFLWATVFTSYFFKSMKCSVMFDPALGYNVEYGEFTYELKPKSAYSLTDQRISNMIRSLILLVIVTSLAACSTLRFPGVHRITVQQGNVITQQMIDKLKPGMTQSQVRFVLGNPVVDDSLDATRWDYIYSISIRGAEPVRKILTVYFVEERLSYFVGDFVPTEEYERIKTQTDQTQAG